MKMRAADLAFGAMLEAAAKSDAFFLGLQREATNNMAEA
mgnify:CR=1 FL=1